MRGHFFRLVAVLLVVAGAATAQQPPLPLPARDLPRAPSVAGTGVITGLVRAADSGAPVRGADIRLTGTGLPRGGVRAAFTDASGRYEFSGLPEGQYTLIASKVRYMTMTYGQTRSGEEGRPVLLATGQRVESVDFALPLGAVITVRVGDRFGDPGIGSRISLFQAKFTNGQRGLAPMALSPFSTTTDDHGEIRLSGLAPGEYYVSAGSGPGPRPGQATAELEVETFYPGTPAHADAQPISVGIGEEVAVAFNTVVSRAARASGTIVGASARPQVRMGRRMVGSGLQVVDVNVGADGSFSVGNLAPGDYEMTVTTPKEMGALRLTVTGADVNGLVVSMNPVVPLRGKVTFEGAPPVGVAQTAFVVRPAVVETLGIPSIAQFKPDWTFEIASLAGAGVLRGELPPGWFLRAVRLDGRDVTDTVLDFQTYQDKAIEVVLTQTATEISGRVVDAAGRDVANYVAVAFPEDQQRWTPLTRAIGSVRPDQQGRFSLRGLPPGRYLVAAIDYLQSGQERDLKLLERLRARATAVVLTEGGTQNVTVTMVP
jgi:hypothetical protein